MLKEHEDFQGHLGIEKVLYSYTRYLACLEGVLGELWSPHSGLKSV